MKRFHLSTLLLLTTLAGAFIGANIWKRDTHPVFVVVGVDATSNTPTFKSVPAKAQGWPFTYRLHYDGTTTDMWGSLAANIAVGLAALALAGYVSEKFARRRGV